MCTKLLTVERREARESDEASKTLVDMDKSTKSDLKKGRALPKDRSATTLSFSVSAPERHLRQKIFQKNCRVSSGDETEKQIVVVMRVHAFL